MSGSNLDDLELFELPDFLPQRHLNPHVQREVARWDSLSTGR